MHAGLHMECVKVSTTVSAQIFTVSKIRAVKFAFFHGKRSKT